MFPFSFIIKFKFNFHILYITLRKIINYIKKYTQIEKREGKQEKISTNKFPQKITLVFMFLF